MLHAQMSRFLLHTILVALAFCFTHKAESIEKTKSHHNEPSFELITKHPQQGSLIIAKVNKHTDVSYLGQPLEKSPAGLVVFGVGREAPESIKLKLSSLGQEKTVTLKVRKRDWNIEKVDGLPPSKVTPKGEEVLRRIREEALLVREARNRASGHESFAQQFIYPAQGRISGVYGSQRILNGEPKRPHFGLDIANETGTPVVAPADGVVALTHPDMYYSGGTLIIDHGFGVSSTYIHLNSIDVKNGQEVKQGDKIGSIGATGRATGPHLDWRLNWYNVRLDPGLLLRDRPLKINEKTLLAKAKSREVRSTNNFNE
ncbi:M23 family metallopeptidase [Aliikangiella sp. G2MR2-5]|uniref:M23 family metallopeptidase n=1 Tax=Aliikangiella sp. G2MR2-5 TaxID=2788943 RepID=UPI001FEFB6C2|nr:M23 family metallopeptidase [Aliikangiella sp. G2MR2-5]